VSVVPVRGFNQTVSLSCSGGHPNANCSISPAQLTLNASSPSQARVVITLRPPKNVDHGTFTLTLVGTSTKLSHSTKVGVTVK
jgi:hypothetical protein